MPPQPNDTTYEVDLDIPDEIFGYLETGSEAYKDLGWEKIKKMLPFTEFFALPKLTFYFKQKVCDQLLDARSKG
jgi:hypothetical protein